MSSTSAVAASIQAVSAGFIEHAPLCCGLEGATVYTRRARVQTKKKRRGLRASGDHPKQAGHRVVETIDHALLQRDDRVVGDGDRFGADFRAALGDVAVADAERVLQFR